MTTSNKAWLQYDRIQDQAYLEKCEAWGHSIVATEKGTIIETAVTELRRGLSAMLGKETRVTHRVPNSKYIVLGTSSCELMPESLREESSRLSSEGFIIRTIADERGERIAVTARTENGVLFGVFELLRALVFGKPLETLDILEQPGHPIRMLNHWGNMDGSIERGYAGGSIFFENNKFVSNCDRIHDYARLLASVGINGLTINNVNVHDIESRLIDETFLSDVAKIALIFQAYGIKLYLSANYASPITLGGLATSDPLDPEVRKWWREAAAKVYDYIPEFGGLVVKADSEGRPGSFTYGRDHAEGANMIAEALHPHNGILFWRCFVYNCKQNWRDRKTDRARAAYDHFKSLDGRFLDNVYLQIKNGPMDFQVREPVSPLFGAMDQTRHLMEFQISQEYTGQQTHLCYLIPQWKEVLEYDTFANGEGSTVSTLIHGFGAVSNIGNDDNWTGHLLAQANLYGFGRLIWNSKLSSEEIANEWTCLTFGSHPEVVASIGDMLLRSWRIYENYTAPLGIGWMVNPHHHYGPNVDGYEYSVWGTYHYAQCVLV
jgi:alpha-glucuronidase